MKLKTVSAFVSVLALLSGCSGAKVMFDGPTKSDGSGLPDGEMTFSLRTTDLVLVKVPAGGDSGSKAIVQTELGSGENVCVKPKPAAADNPKTSEDVSRDKQPGTKQASIVPAEDTPARPTVSDCTANLQVDAIPASDAGIYHVRGLGFDDGEAFASTKLTSTNIDGTNVLTSVTITYTDRTAEVITSVGEGIAGGLAFGPAGAAVGGALAGAVQIVAAEGQQSLQQGGKPQAGRLEDYLCPKDRVASGQEINKPDTPKLMLPIVIDVRTAAEDNPGCWHLLPSNPLDDHVAASGPGNGWLYRLSFGNVGTVPQTHEELAAGGGSEAVTASNVNDKGGKRTSDYFKAADAVQSGAVKSVPSTAAKNEWPYSRCQAALFELVWWKDMNEQVGKTDKKSLFSKVSPGEQVKVSTKAVLLQQIVNPTLVDTITLPEKGGTITLGSMCGASKSYSAYSGSTPGSSYDAVIKEVQSFLTAQKNANAQ